eukprot:7274149-Prymnesium_polylepis.1
MNWLSVSASAWTERDASACVAFASACACDIFSSCSFIATASCCRSREVVSICAEAAACWSATLPSAVESS